MLLDLLKDRYSVRKFSNKMVEQEKLDCILQAGRVSPTAKNFQPQRVIVCRSEDAIKKANLASPCIYGATTVLLVCADFNECWQSENGLYSSLEIDATIVATQMVVEAEEQGLGSCFVLMFDREKTIELFDLPSNIKPVMFIPIGYKDMPAQDRHYSRKPIEETVNII